MFVVAALLTTPSPGVAGARYVGASVAADGRLRIVNSDGQATMMSKLNKQVAFDDIKVAKNGGAVGWLAMYANSSTSYPIPLKLMLYWNGRLRSLNSSGLPVFKWHFTANDTQVAFEQETLHSGFAIHYELHDVASGKLIAQWDPEYGADNRVRAEQTPPQWVKDLNQATHLSPW